MANKGWSVDPNPDNLTPKPTFFQDPALRRYLKILVYFFSLKSAKYPQNHLLG